MFIENKFTTWYYQLIDRANNRPIDSNQYYEKHHIVPRSLGGTNDKFNLVMLTAREHYIAHMLLVRMTGGKEQNKMKSAVWLMLADRNKKRYMPCNRIYEIIRQDMAKALSEQNKGKSWEEHCGKEQVERIRQEYKDGIRVVWNKGKTGVMSQEARNKIAEARRNMNTDEIKQKISAGVNRAKLSNPNGNKSPRPRMKFVLLNLKTNEIVETTNLRSWCIENNTNTARIYLNISDWIIIEKYALRTGEKIS